MLYHTVTSCIRSIPQLYLVLLTGNTDDNALEDGCRQTAPHNRYLRNVAQNPVEEEDERGLSNLGFAKGLFPSWVLCL